MLHIHYSLPSKCTTGPYKKRLWEYASTFNWNYCKGKYSSHYKTYFLKEHVRNFISELGRGNPPTPWHPEDMVVLCPQ